MSTQDGPRSDISNGVVAAKVVDVGVCVEYEVEVAGVQADGVEVGQYHILRGFGHAGVHEEAPLTVQQILREGTRSQNTLDTVYPRYNFHFSPLRVVHVDSPDQSVELRRLRPLWLFVRVG